MLRSGKPFFYLRRRASPALVEAVNALGEPGLAIQREPDRLYPQTSLAAHVLGYTDIDGHGVAGIERAFDKYLSDPATRGQPLMLSIYSRIQQALEHELSDAMTTLLGDRRGRRGHGRPHRRSAGDDLAAGINPNAPGQGTPDADVQPRDAGRFRARLDLQAVHVAMAMDLRRHQELRPDLQLPQRAARVRPHGPRHASVRPRHARSPRS